jgi:diacylglycerol kinase family enzyme
MFERPFFIVNPRSAGGETGRAWDTGLRAQAVPAFPQARWALTAGPGQASALAGLAVREGADLVVAVGGDGTVNEVINGLMGVTLGDGGPDPRAEGARWAPIPACDPVLGILPRGTGCDFVRSLGIPKRFDAALAILMDGVTVEADLCEMALTSETGQPLRRFSMNMCGCGASGEVARSVNRADRPRHGFLAFLLASLRAAAAYRPREVEVSVDGGPPRRVALKSLFVCNGMFCGGGMRIGRGALIDDGLLRIAEIGPVGPARSLMHAFRLYTGRLEGVRGVRVYDARSVTVTSQETVLVDCDGEQPGGLPAAYTVRPRAVRIRASPTAVAIRQVAPDRAPSGA